MLPGGSSSQSSAAPAAAVANFYRFRPIKNPRKIFFRPSISSPSSNKEQETEHILDTPPEISISSTSAISVADNEDLLREIFVKLPPKSLLRFQCVSKQWLSIISSPGFRSCHLRSNRRYDSTNEFLFFNPNIDKKGMDIISFGREGTAEVVGNITISHNIEILTLQSCNVLLCLQIKWNDSKEQLIVYNPTISKHRVIPQPTVCDFEMSLCANIAFDPLKSDHYKLVCVGISPVRRSKRLLVYSSESRAWKVAGILASKWMPPDRFDFHRGLLWNGGIHWFGTDSYSTLCFDLDNERLLNRIPWIPVNRKIKKEYNIAYTGVVGANLYALCVNNVKEMLFDVFALKRDYSEWVVKYQINFAPLSRFYPEVKDLDFNVPCVVADEEEKNTRIVLLLNKMLISCDIDDMIIREHVELVLPEGLDDPDLRDTKWYDALPHVETLASV